jgi:hypothetical protein
MGGVKEPTGIFIDFEADELQLIVSAMKERNQTLNEFIEEAIRSAVQKATGE